MPKGKPLDPETAEGIGELYAKLGNLSGVARALNLPFETVRDVIARGVNARRRQLLEDALNAGIEEGAEHLRDSARELRGVLLREIAAGAACALDPQAMRDLASGQAALIGTQVRAREALERTRNARVARARARAQIALAKAQTELVKAQTTKLVKEGDPSEGTVTVMFVCEPAPEAAPVGGAGDGRGP